MAGRESGAGVVPVERAELVTQDMELIAELISQLYVEHRARFGCADPSRVDGSVRSATAGVLRACLMRYGGLDMTLISTPIATRTRWLCCRGTALSPQPEGSCTSPAEMRSCLRPICPT
jgi:hypothetical protein